MRALEVSVSGSGTDPILAPTGTRTPFCAVTGLQVEGGRVCAVLSEADLGLTAVEIAPESDTVLLRYALSDAPGHCGLPAAAFRPRNTPHTRAADDLAAASRDIALSAGGGRAGIEALVAEAESRFAYAHPQDRFTDGTDAVPYLSCGLTPGSCVDINTYLVASLRAAGFEAAYFYGYFFPQERGGLTDDGHCWVTTRLEGEVLHWDIAHHLKAGLGPTRAGLNPRPGARVAVTHSLGHRYTSGGREIALKVLGEPMRLPCSDGAPEWVQLEAQLTQSHVAPKQNLEGAL